MNEYKNYEWRNAFNKALLDGKLPFSAKSFNESTGEEKDKLLEQADRLLNTCNN